MNNTRRRVRVWLAQNDKSQRWLAEQLGVSEALLSLVLAGKRPCSEELRDDIFSLTGVRLKASGALLEAR